MVATGSFRKGSSYNKEDVVGLWKRKRARGAHKRKLQRADVTEQRQAVLVQKHLLLVVRKNANKSVMWT
jgi:hypothetical protein